MPNTNNETILAALSPLLSAPHALLHPTHQKALMARASGLIRSAASAESIEPAAANAMPAADSSVCVVPVIGVLTRYPSVQSWIDQYLGLCPMMPLLDKVNQAAADPMIETIAVDFDTPGGFVEGTCELANAIAEAAKVKRVVAIIRGLCCSGGYWLASQCSQILARPESQVGNIGVYSVLMDVSEWYASMGVKFELIATGPYKGLGADGKITDALREETQRTVDGLYGLFTAAVAAGRGMSIEDAQAVSDGRAYLGKQAKKLGLIDDVATSFAAALSTSTSANSTTSEESAMSKVTSAQPAAAQGKAPLATVAPLAAAAQTTPPATAAPAAAAIVAPGDTAGAAPAAAKAKSSNAKSAFTKCASSANDHRDQARAAMDAAGAMTDDDGSDDETKSSARACVSALESCADESNRAAEKITQQCKLDDDTEGGGEGGDEGGADGENAKARRINRAVKFGAKDFAIFGDAGYRMFHEGKSFVAAAGETIEALRAENAQLKQQISAAPRGNPAAAFQAEPSAVAAGSPATGGTGKINTQDRTYADGSKFGEGNGINRFQNGIKLPTAK